MGARAACLLAVGHLRWPAASPPEGGWLPDLPAHVWVVCAAAAVLMAAAGYGGFVLRRRVTRRRQRTLISLVGQRTRQLAEMNRLLHQRTLELERANRQLQHLSLRDPLTGVANRRHFEELLDLEWRRAAREGAPLSVLMVDIDFFKAFNDTYGHQAGDECLRLVAGTLCRRATRAGDMVARWGGEEFTVLLPGATSEGARRVAEDIRAAVEGLAIAHTRSSVAKVVTISVGVATGVTADGPGGSTLVGAADRGLYLAKRGGRNQVQVSI
jgi:two-component system chemotaxis family response regulator WspR